MEKKLKQYITDISTQSQSSVFNIRNEFGIFCILYIFPRPIFAFFSEYNEFYLKKKRIYIFHSFSQTFFFFNSYSCLIIWKQNRYSHTYTLNYLNYSFIETPYNSPLNKNSTFMKTKKYIGTDSIFKTVITRIK